MTITDNDIIKALEHCSSDEVGLCHICPLDGECNGDITILLKYALDLINRQKAEIEALTEKLNATIAGQETLQKALAEKNAEISEYQNYINQRLDDAVNELLTTYDVERAKAEAIKEFAVRLKNFVHHTVFSSVYGVMLSISENDFDNLVKEMVGDAE